VEGTAFSRDHTGLLVIDRALVKARRRE
jgi:hypothetical protein